MNIEQLLKQQKESLKDSELNLSVEIADYNQKKIDEITEKVNAVIGKNSWEEFSYGVVCGKILGILRSMAFEFQHRAKLLKELKLSYVFIDEYIKVAGNAPYYSKTEKKVIDARLMDVDKTRTLVKAVATELGIIVTDNVLENINTDAESRRNAKALEVAKDTLSNGGIYKVKNQTNINVHNGDDNPFAE